MNNSTTTPTPAEAAATARVVATLEAGCKTYYTVQDWMVDRLGLSGACLSAFAAVWGMCKADPQAWFWAGHAALAGVCGVSERAAKRAVRSLESMGLVEAGAWIDAGGRQRLALRPDMAGVAAMALEGAEENKGYQCHSVTRTSDILSPVIRVEEKVDKRHAARARGDVDDGVRDGSARPPEARRAARGPKPFEAPTLDQLRAYVAIRGLSVDAAEVHAKLEARGWTDGLGQPIRCWTAYLDGWPALEREREEAARRASSRRPRGRRAARGDQGAAKAEMGREEAERALDAAGIRWRGLGYDDPRELFLVDGTPMNQELVDAFAPGVPVGAAGATATTPAAPVVKVYEGVDAW